MNIDNIRKILDYTVKNTEEDRFSQYVSDHKHIIKKHRLEKCDSILEQIFLMSMRESLKLSYNSNTIFQSTHYHIRPQYKCGKYKIDFAIIRKKIKIAIELDGFAYHDRNKEQFSYERERQNYIVSEGFTVLRFTWDDITKHFRDTIFKIGELVCANLIELPKEKRIAR